MAMRMASQDTRHSNGSDGASPSYPVPEQETNHRRVEENGSFISGVTLQLQDPQHHLHSNDTGRKADRILHSPSLVEQDVWTKPSPSVNEVSGRNPEQAEQVDHFVPRELYDQEKTRRAKLEEENAELKEKNDDLIENIKERRRTSSKWRALFFLLLYIVQLLGISNKGYYHYGVGKVQRQINDIHTGKICCPVCWPDMPCLNCNHLFKEHGAASNSDCSCCSKKENHQHPTVMSHMFAESWFKVVCGKGDRVIFHANPGPRGIQKLTPHECSWQMLCKQHDAATGDMETKLRERLQDKYYAHFNGDSEILQEDADILRMITWRGLLVNVNIGHYEECGECSQYFGAITNFLKRAHDCSSKYGVKRSYSEQNWKKLTVEQAEMLFLFKASLEKDETKYYIELPFVCTMDLSDIDPSLNCCPMIYAQFPQLGCFWAFPLDPDQTTKLQRHFSVIISRINTELDDEHDKFYKSREDAEKWCQGLEKADKARKEQQEKPQQKQTKLPALPLKPRLIIQYLPECCLKVLKYATAVSES